MGGNNISGVDLPIPPVTKAHEDETVRPNDTEGKGDEMWGRGYDNTEGRRLG